MHCQRSAVEDLTISIVSPSDIIRWQVCTRCPNSLVRHMEFPIKMHTNHIINKIENNQSMKELPR